MKQEPQLPVPCLSPEQGASDSDAPYKYVCPIALDVMQDPVVVSSGVTYNRASIQRWFEAGNSTCPVTKQQLYTLECFPNLVLREEILTWLTQQGWHEAAVRMQREFRRNSNGGGRACSSDSYRPASAAGDSFMAVPVLSSVLADSEQLVPDMVMPADLASEAEQQFEGAAVVPNAGVVVPQLDASGARLYGLYHSLQERCLQLQMQFEELKESRVAAVEEMLIEQYCLLQQAPCTCTHGYLTTEASAPGNAADRQQQQAGTCEAAHWRSEAERQAALVAMAEVRAASLQAQLHSLQVQVAMLSAARNTALWAQPEAVLHAVPLCPPAGGNSRAWI